MHRLFFLHLTPFTILDTLITISQLQRQYNITEGEIKDIPFIAYLDAHGDVMGVK